MSDEVEYVEVPDKTTENAVLLLDAAESLGLEPEVVRTTSDGFVVPADVAEKAFPTKGKKAPADKSKAQE